MKRSDIISKMRKTLRESGVKKAYLFGSFARGEKEFHDIDIAIVPPAGNFSLLDLVGLEQKISGQVHRKIDLITLRSLSPYVLPYVKKDLVAL